jgi:hypothetical protein
MTSIRVVVQVLVIGLVLVGVVLGVGIWVLQRQYGSHGMTTLDHMQMHARGLVDAENEFYGRAHTFTADIRKLGEDFRYSDDDSTRVISADSRHWSASVGYLGGSGTCVFGGSWSATGQEAANGPDAIMRAATCSDSKTDRLWHARLAAAR